MRIHYNTVDFRVLDQGLKNNVADNSKKKEVSTRGKVDGTETAWIINI